MQKLLIIETEGPTVRSPAVGWSSEDPTVVRRRERIGLSPSWDPGEPRPPSYDCPLKALADNWHLLGPPQHIHDSMWEWWLVKTKE